MRRGERPPTRPVTAGDEQRRRTFAQLAVDERGGRGQRLGGVLKLVERLELDDLLLLDGKGWGGGGGEVGGQREQGAAVASALALSIRRGKKRTFCAESSDSNSRKRSSTFSSLSSRLTLNRAKPAAVSKSSNMVAGLRERCRGGLFCVCVCAPDARALLSSARARVKGAEWGRRAREWYQATGVWVCGARSIERGRDSLGEREGGGTWFCLSRRARWRCGAG